MCGQRRSADDPKWVRVPHLNGSSLQRHRVAALPSRVVQSLPATSSFSAIVKIMATLLKAGSLAVSSSYEWWEKKYKRQLNERNKTGKSKAKTLSAERQTLAFWTRSPATPAKDRTEMVGLQ